MVSGGRHDERRETMKSQHKMIIAGAAGLVVLALIGAPVWSAAPLLGVLVLCPVIMFLMMRGMSRDPGPEGSRRDAPSDQSP